MPKLITLAEACREFPTRRPGRKHANVATLISWARHGVRLAGTEQRVKLRTITTGYYLTCQEWIDEFKRALELKIANPHPTPKLRGTARKQHERDTEYLRSLGIA